MKVLVATVSSARKPDGVTRHAVNLVRCLLRLPEIDQVDLVLAGWQQQCIESLFGAVDARVRFHIVAIRPSSLARNLWYLEQLPSLAARLHSDVVHATYPVPLFRSGFSCPVVVTLHDLYPYDIPQNFGYPRVLANRLILGHCLAAADAISCVSESTLDRLGTHRPALVGKASCIYNCVEPESESSAVSIRDLDGRSFILAVAQHRSNKNLPLTVNVFRQLLVRNPHLLLVIVGNQGPETLALGQLLSSRELHDRVLLLHGITDGQLQWCYRRCSTLLATSTVEGFGLPVAEAMLVGCPVVCSDLPVFREFGESYCHFIPLSGSVEQRFTEAVQAVLCKPRPSPVSTLRLSGPAIAEAYLQLYRDLLAAHSVTTTASLYIEAQKGASV